ncbi:MAG: preprotein translocase subunit SecY [Clostridiales bacterium]|nr:MAG: preprotein translocase subunit SecY [Clostridiales bacterium]
MFKTIVNAWKIPELRKKILFTVLILVIYRLGNSIPIPFINSSALEAMFTAQGENAFYGYLNMLTGGSFTAATIFALSISPYITASIIVQLLTMAIPAMERMVKEGGEEGRKKQAMITRYATVGLGLLSGFVYYITLLRQTMTDGTSILKTGVFTSNLSVDKVLVAIVIILTFTAGTALVMWLGEQITNKGIGNGISMILFAGILSRFPVLVTSAIDSVRNGSLSIFVLVPLILATIVLIGVVVWVSNAERRLQVQYAKRVIGKKVYGGQASYIPLKVNMTGVLPIIFASSIVSLPTMIASFFPKPTGGFWFYFLKYTQAPSAVYIILYFVLIIAFSFFYAFAQFNPIEVANNMKNNGGFIPGLRPGRPTAEYISRVMKNITVIGALFLAFIAILPIIVSAFSESLGSLALGGTTLLIVVGVALETVQQLESQMIMRHYKGFLE